MNSGEVLELILRRTRHKMESMDENRVESPRGFFSFIDLLVETTHEYNLEHRPK